MKETIFKYGYSTIIILSALILMGTGHLLNPVLHIILSLVLLLLSCLGMYFSHKRHIKILTNGFKAMELVNLFPKLNLDGWSKLGTSEKNKLIDLYLVFETKSDINGDFIEKYIYGKAINSFGVISYLVNYLEGKYKTEEKTVTIFSLLSNRTNDIKLSKLKNILEITTFLENGSFGDWDNLSRLEKNKIVDIYLFLSNEYEYLDYEINSGVMNAVRDIEKLVEEVDTKSKTENKTNIIFNLQTTKREIVEELMKIVLS